MKHAIDRNLRSQQVRCRSFGDVLSGISGGHAAPVAADLVVVDAEGADEMVVRQYLSSGLPPPRKLIYEFSHMTVATQA